MAEWIEVTPLEAGVTALTLNRPERRNALSIGLLEALCAEMERLPMAPANRVVILRGAGPVFSAGLDLREAANSALVARSAEAVQRTLQLVRNSPLIMIAAVQGGAFAGGAGLMAACDVVIAASDAKIGFPEARRGLLPALICDVLAHKVREGDLRELFLVGDAVDAPRAQQLGLVQRIVPADRLLDEAIGVARSILSGGPETIRQTKALLNHTFKGGDSDSRQQLIHSHLTARHSAEAREGLAAFAEKREPNWP